MTDESQISAFYAYKKILITGGTGCMGKALIWKLLQSCPKLDIIYLLIRSKRGKSPLSRKEDVFGAPVFESLKRNNSKLLDKVVFVSGDVGEEGIGLSNKDHDMLIDEVSIIFHSAAILKMDANLRTAINVNTVGTIRMLDMALKMKKLQAFVHISTAFCCCENLKVEEKIYSTKHNPYDIINLTRWMEPALLEKITPELIHPLPNTYIYSKRLTESLLPNYKSKVPIVVARPSIIISSYEEPLPGWNDNLNGPTGFFLAGGTGVMRVNMMNVETKLDVIPVDIAINSILTLPWVNTKEQLMKEINVYNISQTAHKNVTLRQTINLFENAFAKYPIGKLLWYPKFHSATNNSLEYAIKCIFLHYLPAYVIDFILILVGHKPFLVRTHDKLRQGEKVLRYFTQQQWLFSNDKILEVEKILNDDDKRIFPINMGIVKDPQIYADNAVIGCKKYFLKEDMNDMNSAKRIATTMYFIDKVVLILRYIVAWKILMFMLRIFLEAFGMNQRIII